MPVVSSRCCSPRTASPWGVMNVAEQAFRNSKSPCTAAPFCSASFPISENRHTADWFCSDIQRGEGACVIYKPTLASAARLFFRYPLPGGPSNKAPARTNPAAPAATINSPQQPQPSPIIDSQSQYHIANHPKTAPSDSPGAPNATK